MKYSVLSIPMLVAALLSTAIFSACAGEIAKAGELFTPIILTILLWEYILAFHSFSIFNGYIRIGMRKVMLSGAKVIAHDGNHISLLPANSRRKVVLHFRRADKEEIINALRKEGLAFGTAHSFL